MIFGIVVYLIFGALFAVAAADSFQFNMPKWISVPLVVMLWPLAIVFVIWAIVVWMARGSH